MSRLLICIDCNSSINDDVPSLSSSNKINCFLVSTRYHYKQYHNVDIFHYIDRIKYHIIFINLVIMIIFFFTISITSLFSYFLRRKTTFFLLKSLKEVRSTLS